jgi:hypothetical protein
VSKTTPINIIEGMLAHAVKIAGDDEQALSVVFMVMANVIAELPGDNSALTDWIVQSSKQFGRNAKRD